jgi:hypothetical protein
MTRVPHDPAHCAAVLKVIDGYRSGKDGSDHAQQKESDESGKKGPHDDTSWVERPKNCIINTTAIVQASSFWVWLFFAAALVHAPNPVP